MEERIKSNRPRVKLVDHHQPVRLRRQRADERQIDRLRPLQITGSRDIDVEALHVFPTDDGEIAFACITRTGTVNILLRKRSARELNEALTWLLQQQ